MKKFTVYCLIFLTTLFVGVSVLLYLQRNSHATIFCASLDDSMRPRNYCLMNPFRDKQPEKLAGTVLQELKNGKTNVIVPYLKDLTEDRKKHFLENEEKYQVTGWRIVRRTETTNELSLMYWASRKNYEWKEEVYFGFVRKDGEWKLKDFGAIY